MWLDTDRGNRIPAFHIRRGFPLTVLVSHANAEDLGLVLQYWAYMSQQLQVDVFAYEYSGYGHATGKPCEENLYSVRRRPRRRRPRRRIPRRRRPRRRLPRRRRPRRRRPRRRLPRRRRHPRRHRPRRRRPLYRRRRHRHPRRPRCHPHRCLLRKHQTR